MVSIRSGDDGWIDYHHNNDISNLAAADYLETTTQIAITPATIKIENWFGGI